MTKIKTALTAFLLVLAVIIPSAVLAENAAPANTNILEIEMPSGFYESSSGTAYSRYFTEETVLFYENGKGICIRVEKHPSELEDTFDMSASAVKEFSLARKEELEALSYEVRDAEQLIFGGVEYVVLDYSSSRLVSREYLTVAGGNEYRFAAIGEGSLPIRFRKDLESAVKSIVWDSRVIGTEFSSVYSLDASGISFGVPEGWKLEENEDAVLFDCGDGESALFECGKASEFFGGAGEMTVKSVAGYLDCSEEYVMPAGANDRQYVNAIVFSGETLTADYHVFTSQDGMVYHFAYFTPGMDVHRDGFSALINSVDIYPPVPEPEPHRPEPAVKQEEPEKNFSPVVIVLAAVLAAAVAAGLIIVLRKRKK